MSERFYSDAQLYARLFPGDEEAVDFYRADRLASVGEAVPRETLMSDVWDEHWHGPTNTLDVHIAAIRRRLAEAAHQIEPPARIPAITTVRGYGYRLDPQGSGPASDSRETSPTNRLR